MDLKPIYQTIREYSETEIVIQKSRFICQTKPIHHESEAIDFIHQIKKKYWDATHNCYAYRIDENMQKASDDGEPSGTAGRPILEVIQAKELLYTVIVITRYFGGIKLGAGGLIRAYRQSALAAIDSADIVRRSLHQQLLLRFDYSLLGIVKHRLHSSHYLLDEPHFSDKVIWSIWVPLQEKEDAIEQIRHWTQGKVEFQLGEDAFK